MKAAMHRAGPPTPQPRSSTCARGEAVSDDWGASACTRGVGVTNLVSWADLRPQRKVVLVTRDALRQSLSCETVSKVERVPLAYRRVRARQATGCRR